MGNIEQLFRSTWGKGPGGLRGQKKGTPRWRETSAVPRNAATRGHRWRETYVTSKGCSGQSNIITELLQIAI